MLPSSHAYWAARLARGAASRRGYVAFGSVLPDVSGMVIGAVVVLQGAGRDDLMERTYARPPWSQLHLTMHSLLLPSVLRATSTPGSRLRALADGWLSHVAVDLVSHHADSWPPLWPLHSRRLGSPVSYWEPGRHGRARAMTEALAMAAAILTDDQRGRRRAGLMRLALLLLSLATDRGSRHGMRDAVATAV